MSRPDQIVTPVTRLYSTPIPTKRRAVIVQQGQTATVTFQLLDSVGNPVDLTPYATDPCGPAGPQGVQDCWTIDARLREVTAIDSHGVDDATCVVTDIENGLVEFSPPEYVFNNAGVYNAEIGVFNPGGLTMAFSNRCYVWVDRGMFGDPMYPNVGPPTIDEVRMFIRDNGPEENLLLDDFEFDVAEVCQATENAVRYWNEVNPDVGLYFTTSTYCVRFRWLQAIAGHMLIMAAHRFRRNHLPYQAGGLSIDDQNKFQQYEQTGMQMTQEYRDWVKTKKVEINCYAAISSSGSAYGATAYNVLNGGA